MLLLLEIKIVVVNMQDNVKGWIQCLYIRCQIYMVF